ncbi:hypothetical protein LZ31DRAFT_232417 [Colletotrichum somersetense]|nr:hypothetical protein LZ31DRAFT_232417 [Colletotrichum somersetense]
MSLVYLVHHTWFGILTCCLLLSFPGNIPPMFILRENDQTGSSQFSESKRKDKKLGTRTPYLLVVLIFHFRPSYCLHEYSKIFSGNLYSNLFCLQPRIRLVPSIFLKPIEGNKTNFLIRTAMLPWNP